MFRACPRPLLRSPRRRTSSKTMASITALPMLLAVPVLAVLSFLAVRLLRLLRALRGRTASQALPAPASASALGHAKTKTQWARASAAWVPTAFVARVPALGMGLSFPRVPWVRVASDAPEAPRGGHMRRDSSLIELLPTSAPPPPPMAFPPPTGVFSQPAEAEHHQLVDVSDTAGPSMISSYPAPYPYASHTHTQHLPAPRPAHFIPAPHPNAKSLSSPNTRAASPLTRLATTPPPPPHRRSRSLGGVPVRRLSAGSSSGSGLRHAVGTQEGILIDFSSSGEGADADGEGERGASAVSSSSAVSDIGLAALAPSKIPSDSHAALLHPHRVALPLKPIAPLVDIGDASPVKEKEDGGVDDAAWRWFGAPWAPPALAPGALGALGALGRAMPSVPVQVYSAAAAAVPVLLAPHVPGLKSALERPLVDVEVISENEKGAPLDEDPFADPVPISQKNTSSTWNWDTPAANDAEEDEYAAEQRGLAFADDPFADPVPPISIPAPASRVDAEENALVDVGPAAGTKEEDAAPWWDMPVPAPHGDDDTAAAPLLGSDMRWPQVGETLVDVGDAPLVDVEDAAPTAEDPTQEEAPWWDMPAPLATAAEAGVSDGTAPWWDVPATQATQSAEESALISLEDALPYEAERVVDVQETEDAAAEPQEEQAWPDPALMDLPDASASAALEAEQLPAADDSEGEAYPDPELLPLPSTPSPLSVLTPQAAPALAVADLGAKGVIEPTSAPAPASPLASPTPARSGGAPLSQTPTPPASPPPLIAHPRALRALAFVLEKDVGAPVVDKAPRAVEEEKENAPPVLALAIPRAQPSLSRSTSRSTSRATSPVPSPGTNRPEWSRRADDAPALGLPSSGAARRVLGDANANVGIEADHAPVILSANEKEEKGEIEKGVPSLKVTFAPQEPTEADDEEEHSLPGSFPTTPTIAIAPPTPTAAQFGAVGSKTAPTPSTSSTPSTAASEITPAETTPTSAAASKTTPASRLRARAGTWAPALARSGPLDLALAMQLRPGLGAGADPAWMVRFLMAVYGWVVVSVAGGF
ncbi:hypothetical protein HYPSUDRAFT_1003155 [Hypholoma sublateritium FD-334 SS-4]|uniref:Uncharacterized protein n=1 Tax=Hypholoma sublateritium (strain FD-334 SS-4) TaxID=945553 RepID=A0A0D2NFR3_HYPSF|nr:hypothetical protein HYPSUDRAFT_1003155 [Hypholoma sublateritium FD-334 SS-4]